MGKYVLLPTACVRVSNDMENCVSLYCARYGKVRITANGMHLCIQWYGMYCWCVHVELFVVVVVCCRWRWLSWLIVACGDVGRTKTSWIAIAVCALMYCMRAVCRCCMSMLTKPLQTFTRMHCARYGKVRNTANGMHARVQWYGKVRITVLYNILERTYASRRRCAGQWCSCVRIY